MGVSGGWQGESGRPGHVGLYLDDASLAAELCRYQNEQGFPTVHIAACELETLFPGDPAIFASAVELDLWRSRHPKATVTVHPQRGRC